MKQCCRQAHSSHGVNVAVPASLVFMCGGSVTLAKHYCVTAIKCSVTRWQMPRQADDGKGHGYGALCKHHDSVHLPE
jgi:hypothetical protein